jgi:hypothetical protein
MNETLILGNFYSKKDLSLIFDEKGLLSSREGIFSSKTLNSYLFFVDLVKEGKEDRFHFNDYFDGDLFHWDSQTTQQSIPLEFKESLTRNYLFCCLQEFIQRLKVKHNLLFIVED